MNLSNNSKPVQLAFNLDPAMDALRIKFLSLKSEIQDLIASKSELEKIIYEFGIKHNQILGSLILKLLKLRKDETKGTQFESETESEYNQFYNNYEKTKDKKLNTLNDNDLKELKEKYRKASKLCHPDVVSDEMKDLAHQLFTELNNAYRDNDLETVSKILTSLESGELSINQIENVSEHKLLLSEIDRLIKHVENLNIEINEILNSNIYNKIINISNFDIYFENARNELLKQIAELEDGK